MFLKPIFPQNFHLSVKNIRIVKLQKLLVSKVYAKLLETVFLEVLEAEDVEDIDFFESFRDIVGSQAELYFVEDKLKDCIIYGFAKGMKVGDAVLLVVWTQCILFQELLSLV